MTFEDIGAAVSYVSSHLPRGYVINVTFSSSGNTICLNYENEPVRFYEGKMFDEVLFNAYNAAKIHNAKRHRAAAARARAVAEAKQNKTNVIRVNSWGQK